MSDETLCYLYGVVDAAAIGSLRLGPGVDGAEVRCVGSGDLAGVVSEVPASRFGESALSANLEDLAWLTETARAHHRVVDAVNRTTPIVPVRMATVLLGPGRVVTLLAEQRDRFTAALDRVRDRQEWGVKAYLSDPPAAPEATEPAAAGRPGTAYLLRKRAERESGRHAAEAGARRAAELHEALAAIAVASRTYPPQDPRLSGRPEPMLLNAAYLVANPDVPQVRGVVADFDSAGLRVEVTGPWAPYSFAAEGAR